MKQKVVFLIGIVLLFVIIGIIITVIRTRAPKQGELKVESQPAASVFLDEKHIGRTPIGKTSYKVNPGEYALKIVPDTGAIAFANFQEKIKITPNTLTYIDVSLSESELTTSSYVLGLEKMTGKKSELSVISTPDSANILLDDEPKGITPMIISDLTPGDHTLSIVSRGFVTRTIKIKLNAGYRLIASVRLALAAGGSTLLSENSATQSALTSTGTPTPTLKKNSSATLSGTLKPSPTKSTASGTDPEKPFITIKDNELGFLRVRSEASSASSSAEVARVNPGDTFHIFETKSGWYKIEYMSGKTGWVNGSTQRVEKTE